MPLRPAISFEDVSLRYSQGAPWALEDVNLTLAPGARVAVVGPSGAGKSSLVGALLKLYPLQRGRVLLDDVDLVTITFSKTLGSCGGAIIGASDAIELLHPELDQHSCEDYPTTVATRKRLCDTFIAQGALIIPAHFTTPHAGYLREDGGKRRFEPLATAQA